MDLLITFAIAAGIIGIIGSIVPGIPGPPISWIGILLAFFVEAPVRHPVTMTAMLVWLGITVIVTILDYVIPAQFTRMTGGTRYASSGALIGMVLGLLIPPLGILVGALLGAFISELCAGGKDVGSSIKASLGAFLGFICGTGLKLAASGIMMYYIVVGCF